MQFELEALPLGIHEVSRPHIMFPFALPKFLFHAFSASSAHRINLMIVKRVINDGRGDPHRLCLVEVEQFAGDTALEWSLHHAGGMIHRLHSVLLVNVCPIIHKKPPETPVVRCERAYVCD